MACGQGYFFLIGLEDELVGVVAVEVDDAEGGIIGVVIELRGGERAIADSEFG